MHIGIFEVCRSPEVPKWDTEGQVLRAGLQAAGLAHVLHSNDHCWRGVPGVRQRPGLAAICAAAGAQRFDALHFATHGTEAGLVLAWRGAPGQRVPHTVLTPALVRERLRLHGQLVVSGACQSAHLADDFLAAGAAAVVAPSVEVPWANLGAFFLAFYQGLAAGRTPRGALNAARRPYPELASYRCYSA